MAELRLIDLQKRYGDAAAVRGISIGVRDGELLALLGPSGCGKTTTLQLLAGFLEPDGGEIWADDRLLSSVQGVVPPERRNMGMVFQGYALWPHMTVAQNVSFGLQMRRANRSDIGQALDWVLGIVNLRGYENRYPHELSGGQQQRVALARSLVVRPDTLLLDEPLSNLDANLREQMRFEIRRVHQETNITMVYVTHDQAEAMVIADRIAVLNGGVVEQIGAPGEIFDQPASRFVAGFIGQANCLPVKAVDGHTVRLVDSLFQHAGGAEIDGGSALALAVRPAAVQVVRDTETAPSTNTVRARLVSDVYLGDQRDLRFELRDGTSVRVLVSSAAGVEIGSEALLHIPSQHCRLVADG
ncbi:MAG: ABC transporter ATP-binding protein [Chloroflexota bacterium]